jgi:hypothetical protein
MCEFDAEAVAVHFRNNNGAVTIVLFDWNRQRRRSSETMWQKHGTDIRAGCCMPSKELLRAEMGRAKSENGAIDCNKERVI